LLGSAAVAWQVSQPVPFPDECAYSFHAKVMATGHYLAAAPPGASFLAKPSEVSFNHHVITPLGWTSMYPPVWPALLALGFKAGVPWLVNPIVGMLLVCLTWALAETLFDQTTAAVATLLLVPAPYFLAKTGSLMPHAISACLLAAAVLFIARGLPQRRAALIAGASTLLAVCFFARPFTAVGAGAALACVIVFHLRSAAFALRVMAGTSIVCLGAVAAYLLLNHLVTGSYFITPYALAANGTKIQELTFNIRDLLAYSPKVALYSWVQTFQFSVPFLYVAAVFAFFSDAVPRWKIVLLLAPISGLCALYVFDAIPQALLFGERMYFDGFPEAAVAGAAGIMVIIRRWRPARAVIWATVLGIAAIQGSYYFAMLRSIQVQNLPGIEFRRVASSAPTRGGVVFLKSKNLSSSDWMAPENLNMNEPDWKHAANIYLIDPEPTDRRQITLRYGRSRYAVIVYDARTHHSSMIADWDRAQDTRLGGLSK
jgi:hypothetical protein